MRHCQICHTKIDHVVMLAIKGKPTMACPKCAAHTKAYCKKHHTPHIGVKEGNTACPVCINDLVESYTGKAKGILQKLRENLPKKMLEELKEATKIEAFTSHDTKDILVLRFIATHAEGYHLKIEDVINDIIEKQSIRHVIP